jgi:hypothetical protein
MESNPVASLGAPLKQPNLNDQRDDDVAMIEYFQALYL